jgi:hypothetical protein
MKTKMLLIAMVFLFSCTKEECKICTTIITTTYDGNLLSKTETSFEACGDDVEAVDGKVINSSATYGQITAKVYQKTTCK